MFVSEELTAWFKGEPQAVHVLCYGITADDHEWLQAHADDVEQVAEYLHEREIACALAHPFYAVEAPLTPRHRRRLAQLFGVWETRNGSRARELNAPAAVYVETHGGTGVAGSDDHAGIDIGRTFTETPTAHTWHELLGHVRAGRAAARGEQGSAAKWAHSAMALAVRALGRGDGAAAVDPRAVLTMVERVMREGDVRRGAVGADLGPDDARAPAARVAGGRRPAPRRARAARATCSTRTSATPTSTAARGAPTSASSRARSTASWPPRPRAATSAPPRPASSTPASRRSPTRRRPPSWAARRASSSQHEGDPLRVALVADGVGAMHGVTHTLDEIRERGVPGFEVEVVGTDANVDRRLSAVAEVDIPFYAGLKVGVPSLPAIVEALAEGRYDLVHLCSPGPAGVAAARDRARHGGAGARHLPHRAGRLRGAARGRPGARVHRPRRPSPPSTASASVVLSPSPASDEVAARDGHRRRAHRALGPRRRHRALLARQARRAAMLPGELSVLYAGRLTREKGADLLADAFLAARERDPRLHLCLAGGGPEEDVLRERLGEHATFLGWLEGDALARAYASADLFLFASRTDTFGQVLLEAQASGLPVVAVAEGGPCSIVEDGVTGRLCPPDAQALAARRARARGLAAAARAPRAARAGRGARAHLGARADPPGRRLPPRPGRAPGGGGAACRLAHCGSSMGRLRSRPTVSRSARRQATGGSPRSTSSRSATTRPPMARKASGMPPVRCGESSRPSTLRAGWSAGTGSRGHTSIAARRRPAAASSIERVEVDHGGAAHHQQRGASAQQLELAAPEQRLVVRRGRGEDEDHARAPSSSSRPAGSAPAARMAARAATGRRRARGSRRARAGARARGRGRPAR